MRTKNRIQNRIKISEISWVVTILLLLCQSCTDKFEEINTDRYAISDEELVIDFSNIGGPIVQAQQNLYPYSAGGTQLGQNLIGDVYAGYMMPPTPFASNSNNMTYKLVDGWNAAHWRNAYQNVMAPLDKSDKAGGEDFVEFKAWSKILRVEAMHRVSDIYGPIIYSKFGETLLLYDCQEAVYKLFFEDLASAIATLTLKVNDTIKPLTPLDFTPFDYVYGGSYEKWIRFANSLRLRLAIRVSIVNPELAQTEGEAALNHPVGVLEKNNQNFLVKSVSGTTHPLNVINDAWNDVRMGAPMESILKGYNDPRIASYFRTASDNKDKSLGIKGKYKGIRAGIRIAAKANYQVFSPLATFQDVQLMTASEVYFLKAEAALRGWAGAGDAKENYETGIQISYAQHDVGDVASYIADNSSTAIDYVDPHNPENNIKAASTITIAYNTGDSFALNLERIITQKWIAMYPDGQEAWSEFRRTGYPKLFLNKINLSDGKIPEGTFIKRINFTSDEQATNPQGVSSGKGCLNGDDNGGTNLWWDVD